MAYGILPFFCAAPTAPRRGPDRRKESVAGAEKKERVRRPRGEPRGFDSLSR